MSIESSVPPKGSKRVKRRARLMTPLIARKENAASAAASSRLKERSQTSAPARTGESAGFSVGTRVVFESDGLNGSGVIDDLMPDASVMWIWPDDAMGRKMLCLADTVVVTYEEAGL